MIGPLLYKVGQLPVYRGRGDAGLVLKQAEQALRDGRVRDRLPGGDRDPGPGPVADGGQDRRGPAGADHRGAGDPDRALGRAGHPALRHKKPHLFPRKTVRMVAGPPVDLSAYAGQRLGASDAARGHRRHHGRHHRAAGRDQAARRRPPYPGIPPRRPCWRPGPNRTAVPPLPTGVRAGRGGTAGRSSLRRAHESGGHGGRVLGHHVRPGALRRRDLAPCCTPAGRSWPRRSRERHENPDYLPGIALTPALDATSDPAEALAGADLVVFAVPAQSLRANLADWAPLIPPGALLVSLMKGIELGTCKRMSEVISRGARRRRGPGRGGLRAEPGPRDRQAPVRRHRGGLRRAGRRAGAAGRVPHAVLPPVHQHRRDRLRARRRGEEHHRDRGRHRGGDGARATTPGPR